MILFNKSKLTALLLTIASVAQLQAFTIKSHPKFGLFMFLSSLVLILILNSKMISASLKIVLPLYSIFLFGSLVSMFGHPTMEAFSFYKSVFSLFFAMLAWSSSNLKSKEYLLEYLSIISFISVVCVLIGSYYAITGGQPLFSVENADGANNAWYLTTFSRENYGGIIRGAWIFDEPGTLSYFITFIAVARELSNKSRWLTIFILVGGLVTFSTAHLAVVFLFTLYFAYMYYLNIKTKLMRSAFIVIVVICTLSLLSEIFSLVQDSLFFARINSSEGLIAGNNRSDQVVAFLDNIDLFGLVFGHPQCITHVTSSQCIQFVDQTSNIFSPIFYTGVIAAIPFYALYTILATQLFIEKSLLKKMLVVIVLAVLFQRPFFYIPSYILIGFITMHNFSKNNTLINFLLCRKKLFSNGPKISLSDLPRNSAGS